jgi:hypothetical protein
MQSNQAADTRWPRLAGPCLAAVVLLVSCADTLVTQGAGTEETSGPKDQVTFKPPAGHLDPPAR